MNELLKPYVPLVDFLADYLGSNAEVLLHDLTNLEHSIVKIRNGHISGRKEGDPCTDFALRIVQKPPEDKQYSTNYKSCHKDGFPMKSGTFFIRNAGNRIIGMLCINIDSTLRCWQPPGERAGLTVYVELGPATGHNWWGVLYPEALKLCAIEEPSAKPIADETDAPVVFSWPVLRWLAGLLGWKATGL